MFSGRVHEAYDDMLHCQVACEIAQRCGIQEAIIASHLQEIGNDWTEHKDTQDDLVADYYGIQGVENCPQVDCHTHCKEQYLQERAP